MFKKVVVYPHTYSVFGTHFLTPLFFRGKKHMSECVLQLVRVINKKHFDENFSNSKLCFYPQKDCFYRFCGGSYGGKYDQMAINIGWQKDYRKTYAQFMLKVKEKLAQLTIS